jgi:hypothetical protein
VVVDPELIGVTVRVGGRLINGSVAAGWPSCAAAWRVTKKLVSQEDHDEEPDEEARGDDGLTIRPEESGTHWRVS